MLPRTSTAIAATLVAALAAGAPPVTLVYRDDGSPTSPAYRQFVDGAWSVQGSASPVSSGIEWVVMQASPIRAEMALVTSLADKSLTIQFSDTTTWEDAAVLATDCGTTEKRPFDAVYSRTSGRLMVAYRKGASTSIYYRNYSTPAPAEESYSPGLSATPDWICLSPKPGSDEIVMTVAAGSRLYGAVWNGVGWGNFTTHSTSFATYGRALDMTHATKDGAALVVWGQEGSSSPRYRLWTGFAWTSVASAPSLGGSSTPTFIRLASNPVSTSNEIILAAMDDAHRIKVCNWTGAGWGTMTTLTSVPSNAYERRVDIAYQPDGSRALVVWHEPGSTSPRWRTWNGSAWSSASNAPALPFEARTFLLTPGEAGDEVHIASLHRSAPLTLDDYTAYSKTGTVDASRVIGLEGQQLPDVSLPSPPTDPAGSTDKTYGNHATASLGPGAYRDLRTGVGVTLNLSAGRYVFREWKDAGNSNTLNCDTTGGDTTIIFRNGDIVPGNPNNFHIVNNGPGRVFVHVVNGNFETHNNTNMECVLYVYNGNIEMGNNTTVRGALYAKGDIDIGSGIVEMPSDDPAPAPRLSTMRWAGGVISTPVSLCSSMPRHPRQDLYDACRPSQGAKIRVTRWREVGPENE